MWLIVVLGNPGVDYEWSRHNLGFMLIDKLAHDEGIVISRRECSSLVGRGEVEGVRIKLAKPQTYMNLSGQAVSCLLAKLNVESPVKQLIVISDDLALPLGKIRVRERGSAGGHNGLKSIIAALGTNEFVRLRIGIQPEHPVSDAKKFVLNEFAPGERRALKEILERSDAAVRSVLREGIAKAMSLYN